MFERSAGWAHRVTNDKSYPFSDKSLSHIETYLPGLLWETSEDLDDLVLAYLTQVSPLTGSELARLCGAGKRTIKTSIKRLREAGYKIGASMKPPRGYSLEEESDVRESTHGRGLNASMRGSYGGG